jgi:hypothetical protein
MSFPLSEALCETVALLLTDAMLVLDTKHINSLKNFMTQCADCFLMTKACQYKMIVKDFSQMQHGPGVSQNKESHRDSFRLNMGTDL